MATTTTCDICGEETDPEAYAMQDVAGGQWRVAATANVMDVRSEYRGGDACETCMVMLVEDAARLLRMGLEDLEGGGCDD